MIRNNPTELDSIFLQHQHTDRLNPDAQDQDNKQLLTYRNQQLLLF